MIISAQTGGYMTHERAADHDDWDTLPDATTIEAAPLPGVPIGDVDPDAEWEMMLESGREAGQ